MLKLVMPKVRWMKSDVKFNPVRRPSSNQAWV